MAAGPHGEPVLRVVFRADASLDIGAGHVMRCLTLADVLKEWGAEILFLCRRLPGHLGDLLGAREYALAWLQEGITPEADAAACLEVLVGDVPWDWLVVDHYALAATWEREMRDVARHILAIDDVADRAHDCDFLLDQNLGEPSRYQGLLPAAGQTLLGPRYALLRPQFVEVRERQARRDGTVRRLLVFCGSGDSRGDTLKVLGAIARLGHAGLAVDVVIGQANPHAAAIETACQGLPGATLHVQTTDMAGLMAAADLFVGAGGSSSWERCCLDLPAIVLATADNQVGQARALAEAGAHFYLGPAESVTVDSLTRLLACALETPELLRHMAEQGRDLVDGRGAGRVAVRLLASGIGLRRATAEDSGALLAWRNHPQTRRHSFDPAEIALESHERWFAAVLADPHRELLIAELDGRPLGVLRYDIDSGRAHVSIYLVPGLSGLGWGTRLLQAGETWLREQRPDVGFCEAEIAATNVASLGAFRAAGFLPRRATYGKELYDAQP
jgi:UDP-2,4-diacetamido-2,4,6-trideoxy-beta-L-altropyranose hydrolase